MPDKGEVIRAATILALKRNPPRCQYDTCLIAARISIALGDIPETDADFISAAHGQAVGLFGPAFEAADDGKRTGWIDMCERALREAANAPMAG